MKTLFASAAIFGGLAIAAAGAANAATAAQCEAQAQQYAEQQYPTGGGAVSGAVGGAILGGLIAGATGKNVGSGVGIGAGAGLVVGSVAWQNAKKQAHDTYFNNCISQGVQPVYAPPPPPYSPPPTYFPAGSFNAILANTSSLNVRQGPGTGYAIIGQLSASPPGYPPQVFGVLGCNGGWCQLTSGGWVSQGYLQPVSG
jgi:uncharacterized protein YraI